MKFGVHTGGGHTVHGRRGHWSIENKIHWVRDVTLPGSHNSRLARFAPTLAAKALRHTTDQHGYAANLVSFARQASTGTIPPDRWQIEHLGHRINTRQAT